MAYIGRGRGQQTLFPMTLDDLIPGDHVCRVIEAFVVRLDMAALGFVRAEAGRNRASGLRSARSAEAVSVRLSAADPFLAAAGSRVPAQRGSDVAAGPSCPDHKSIAEFRRLHREAVTKAGRSWCALRAR